VALPIVQHAIEVGWRIGARIVTARISRRWAAPRIGLRPDGGIELAIDFRVDVITRLKNCARRPREQTRRLVLTQFGDFLERPLNSSGRHHSQLLT
jgi:hypothetical protein